MAVQTRVLIQAKDILGVEFECPQCGTKVLYSLEKAPFRIAETCPNCNEGWFAPISGIVHPEIPSTGKQVLEGIATFQRFLQRPDVNARIRLQVTDKHED